MRSDDLIMQMNRLSAALMPRAVRTTTVALATAVLAGCGLFETDINNPNAVVESALGDPAGAAPLVNGLYGIVQRATNQITGTVGAVSDELTWAGSREYWKLLDDGDIADPVNEYTNGQFPYMGEARWTADYVVGVLEGLDKQSPGLKSRLDLAKAYLYAGQAYLIIAENYEDFVISSDRTKNGPPIGDAAFAVTYDSSLAYFNKALTLATTLNNADVKNNALGLKARALFSKSLLTRFRPARNQATIASPYLVNDAAVTAAAQAALASMPTNYKYQMVAIAQNNGGYFNTGFEINQRLELRIGDEYANLNAAKTRPLDGVAGVKLLDPVDGTPDKATLKAIDDCCRQTTGQFLSPIITSKVEMNLILAEAAMVANNTTDFTTNINAARATFGLAPWAGTPSQLAILKHSRRTMLFMQGRRLADHYRFGEKADKWLTTQTAYRKACFFPLSYDERLQNPLTPQPPVVKAANCT